MFIEKDKRAARLKVFVSGPSKSTLKVLEHVAEIEANRRRGESIISRLRSVVGKRTPPRFGNEIESAACLTLPARDGWSVEAHLYATGNSAIPAAELFAFKHAGGAIVVVDAEDQMEASQHLERIEYLVGEFGYESASFPVVLLVDKGASLSTPNLSSSLDSAKRVEGDIKNGAGVEEAIVAVISSIWDLNRAALA